MRPFLWLLCALLAISLVPPVQAVADGGCGTGWSSPGSACLFVCDGPTLSVLGNAGAPGAAAIEIVAECGVTVDGAFHVLGRVECSGSGMGSTACTASTFDPLLSLGLEGRCRVAGTLVGSYECKTTL